jgi:excinuclease ABC subunit B
VIFYADRTTDSMRRAIEETERRREKQAAYNTEHGIEPRTILKDIHSPLVAMQNLDYYTPGPQRLSEVADDPTEPLARRIERMEKAMRAAAKRLEFEEAAELRDQVRELKELQIYAG